MQHFVSKFFCKVSENYIAMGKKCKCYTQNFHIFKIIDCISRNREARIKQMDTDAWKNHHKHMLQLQSSRSSRFYMCSQTWCPALQHVVGDLYIFRTKLLVKYVRNNTTFTCLKFQNDSSCIFADFQQKVQCQKCPITYW